jgi:hypothetical protein
MFLLLPGLRCMRRAASVTPLLRRDPQSDRVGGGSVGRKQASQWSSRSALLLQIRGALLISVGLVGPTACAASVARTAVSAVPQY